MKKKGYIDSGGFYCVPQDPNKGFKILITILLVIIVLVYTLILLR